jgi:cytochrome P450
VHRARLKYVKSNDYEPIRAAAGTNLMTDEGDSWAAHRTTLNPTFARRHLNEIVDLMIDPIERITADITAEQEFDMHATMVEATLRVVANALFSEDFGPLVHSTKDLTTRGLRRTERLGRIGLLGLMRRPVYDTLSWCTFSGVPLPPPLREGQRIALALDAAVNALLDDRIAHPTDSADLLNVLFHADDDTWPRRRIRDEALTFMLAGHETTANAMSWFWYLLSNNPDARERMLVEVDDVLAGRRPTAADLTRLPWTTACLQESQRYYSAVWIIAREAVEDDIVDGHHIRPGSTVLIPIHHIHHDERWWPNPRCSTRTASSAMRPRTGPDRRTCRSAAADGSASDRASR